MKPQFINKIADLMTNPKSEHRVLPDGGEFRLGGSTPDLGSFELTVTYEGDHMTLSGSIARQYISVTQQDGKYVAKFQRRQGGQVREPITLGLRDTAGFVKFLKNWTQDVIKEG